MSRPAAAGRSSVSNGIKDDDGGNASKRDECPVCHSKRYLRPDMKFLINPECYHMMCDSCVDRIFAHGGVARCPIPGCNKMLRRGKFRAPTFEDMRMEREVDIRKHIASVFNRREDEFEDLRAYNDYLNDVEDLTFNLINNIDVEDTNRKLAAYEEAHRESIAANKKIERLTSEIEKQRQADQIKHTQLLREAALQESQEERKERETARMDIINRLATERGDARMIAREGEKVLQSVTNRRGHIMTRTAVDSSNGADSFAIRGLKQVLGAEPDKPYDPFGGMVDIKDFVVIPEHPNLWNDYLGKLRKNDIYSAGGYSLNEFYARSLSDVFSGLDIFIGQEKVRDDRKASSKVSNAAAATVAETDVKMTDVFS